MGKAKGKNRKRCSSIGGQAVLEGVMMRGRAVMATAVRNPDGNIVIESERMSTAKPSVWKKVPIVRGVINFFGSMVVGVKTLMRSAEVFGELADGEPSKFEKWLAKKTKIDIMDIAIGIGLVLGVGLSIFLFFIVPQLLTSLIFKIPAISATSEFVRSLIEGVLRLGIFVGYILLVTLMPDIKRTFMYHGAEHKVISCYEHDLPLDVKNAQTMSTVHDRCGTTFMFLVMVIAILFYALISSFGGPFGHLMTTNIWFRIGMRLLLLPVIAGVSYEFLKLFAKSDNIIFRIFKFPGLLLQKLTTKQPTDQMVEVALAAFNRVMEMESDADLRPSKFDKQFRGVYNVYKSQLTDEGIAVADLDWLVCDIMKVSRSSIATISLINVEQEEKLDKAIQERLTGKPVQYIIGHTDFCGNKICITKDTLIPRFDTENLAVVAIETINEMGATSVLDLCTGSGAIAVTLAKACSNIAVSASDISKEALVVATENSKKNEVTIAFIESDMFAEIKQTYDVIVSNPPYIKRAEIANLDKEVKNYEPMGALDGGEDGLTFYKIIAENVGKHLTDNGVLILEIGDGQGDEVSELLLANGFANVTIKFDLSEHERVIVARNLRKK